ncbi:MULTISPECIES: DUF427 domain-containing protein [Aphanothece]|uniref:DUF427 domain-containing protein n=1 Tax=Aphanothece TaxID=1121 RepID=UPI003984D265
MVDPVPGRQDAPGPARHPLERVADYPRPPALVAFDRPVRVEALGQLLALSDRSLWVKETFHPPTVYLPPDALRQELLSPAAGHSYCEWKGVASYWDVVVAPGGGEERRLRRALWSYPHPSPAYAPLAGWFSLYPGLMDGCWVDGVAVVPQPGGFYGGWILPWHQGPFKGDPAHPELV